MYYLDEYTEEPLWDEPIPDDDWVAMTNLIDQAPDFYPDDAWSTPPKQSYAVLRIVFHKGLPPGAHRLWEGHRPTIHRQTRSGRTSRPYTYTGAPENGLVFLPQSNEPYMDVMTWQPYEEDPHGHPENQAITWLQQQRNTNPSFTENISGVRVLIQDSPCKSCTQGLRHAMAQALPAPSQARVRWIKPQYRPQSFRERHYQPKVTRWKR